ncbi:RipA family octameric membrane protein [Lentiprolixibacter aurantiacus]|uniref:Uncharacterized protein n=1 Tax=Lentiprolixibacter aurantiacus TaxID=2993939 RepID=A0AAE3MK96_9FLAO|nr:hypothetical protein [Lentiprolixibacter aurantiacus]MCX2718763.1 hypothetical protein [Lentiprolixibacter aurantiacus]
MAKKKSNNNETENLRAYLDVGIRLRNNELNIQMIRNAIFTGVQVVLVGSFIAFKDLTLILELIISAFGILISISWILYYKSSLFWVRYWEERTSKVNDAFLELAEIDVNLFNKHPASGSYEEPLSVEYGGKTLEYSSVHSPIKIAQIGFLVLWFTIFIGVSLCNIDPRLGICNI